MNTYLVFEKVPSAIVNGRPVDHGIPDFSNQTVTAVQADNAQEAVNTVMAATRRFGQYAVVECSMVNFLPNVDFDSGSGVLRSTPKELNGGTDND